MTLVKLEETYFISSKRLWINVVMISSSIYTLLNYIELECSANKNSPNFIHINRSVEGI